MRTSKTNDSVKAVLEYQGQQITFRTVNGVLMVNATEMAKLFKKHTADFLKTKETKTYIEALSQYENIHSASLVSVQNGGKNRGTWIHELLAIRFAQWLSPEFSVWVDVNIRNLLTAQKEPQTLKSSTTELLELTDAPEPIKSGYILKEADEVTITFKIAIHGTTASVIPDKFLYSWFITPLKNTVDQMYLMSRTQHMV